jgi:hypothetical protein
MSKLTESARGETCTVRLPSVCNHNPETVVLAHISGVRFGHGMGKKTSDIHGAYACSACHDVLDGRTYTNISKDFRKMAHLEGVIETQMRMIEKGLIK